MHLLQKWGLSMHNENQSLIFEITKEGRVGYSLEALDVPEIDLADLLPANCIREEAAELPEVSELDIMRHYTALSRRNHGVDSGFYPLGSCTMKYNPKINESVARLSGFANVHPLQDESTVQGAMELLYELQTSLVEITGMDEVTLQPAAGAHGEWTALMMIRAFHEANGEGHRNKVIVPDSAHGTNPASATVAGFETITVKSDENGLVDIEDLRKVVGTRHSGINVNKPKYTRFI